jgi:predicted Na+-dependent transporter
MTDALAAIANVAILTFVLASMVSLGLSLTVPQIMAPLRDLRTVGLALAANFVAAPLLAWAIGMLLGLDQPLLLGLVLLGVAAGAPVLPKLAQLSKADVAWSVGLMVLLMVVTVVYIPLVLVPLVQGVDVSAWDIARPLVFGMLLPLLVALAVRSRYDAAARLAAPLNQVATTALALGVVLILVVQLPNLIDAFGTGAFIANLLFIAATLGVGWLLGGSIRDTRLVTAVGTAQRNISAALLIAGTSFLDQPLVLVMVMVGGVMAMAILLPMAAELGRREAPPAQA